MLYGAAAILPYHFALSLPADPKGGGGGGIRTLDTPGMSRML
jgi:hypothetical protein